MHSHFCPNSAKWILVWVLVLAVALGGCAQQVAPSTTPAPRSTQPGQPAPTSTQTSQPTRTPVPTSTPLPTPTPTPVPIVIAPGKGLPQPYADRLRKGLGDTRTSSASGSRPVRVAEPAAEGAGITLSLVPLAQASRPLARRFFAVVVPFATVADDISLGALRERWQGQGSAALYAPEPVPAELEPVLGTFAAKAVPMAEMLASLENDREAIAILPFERLDPFYKVLSVDGITVLSNTLDPTTYPLAVALEVQGNELDLVWEDLQRAFAPETNREPSKLTSLIMTGVTAMTRMTALKMEQKGFTYPAEIISATLSAADITHVSNEVPFIKGCQVNATSNNLIMCSDVTYWAALEAIGTDIVGLSGNHVNDFGRDGARESLQFYRELGVPVYGSGLNTAEACAPLRLEHNGNTFAFVAALAFEPSYAWSTETEPGACYFYDHKEEILALVTQLSEQVDVVAVELQYYETYQPYPTERQVEEFRELRAAGADIVTGVQSHVPQAMEPYGAADTGGPGIIVYGLGNLFFDQMWSWETRTELYVRHTIYDGRLISTEILTGALEDYAQPRWTTPDERAEILTRIFDAAPARPE